jgi:hypothetical protein
MLVPVISLFLFTCTLGWGGFLLLAPLNISLLPLLGTAWASWLSCGHGEKLATS